MPTYATASALAKEPGATERMAYGHLAHQSTPSARVLSPGHSPPSRSHQDGQHDSGSVYKSPRWCELAATAAAGERPPSVDRSIPPLHPGRTCPRTPDARRRFTVEGQGNPQVWRLHPLTVNMIWSVFGRAEVDLFASAENTHCPLFYSLTHAPLGVDALAHSWPKVRPYAFPLVKLLPRVLCKIKEEKESVLLVAPKWPNQPWFPELVEMLVAPPWTIPLKRDLLSQAQGTDMAPKSRVMEPSCLAARRSLPVTDALPQRMLNPISEASSPSTRCLYAHKWRVFKLVCIAGRRPIQLSNTNNSCLPSRVIW